MFDLYSCKEFDVNTVIEMLKEFNTKSLQFKVIDRDTHEIIEEGFRNFESELILT
jgi:hypothetical protein